MQEAAAAPQTVPSTAIYIYPGGPAKAERQDTAWVQSIAWAVALVVIVVTLRHTFASLLGRARAVSLKIAGQEVNLDLLETRSVLQPAIDEMLRGAGDAQLSLFQLILKREPELSVETIFPDFARDTPQHTLLGDMRARGLIRPSEGGSWRLQKHPVTTAFARALAKAEPRFFQAMNPRAYVDGIPMPPSLSKRSFQSDPPTSSPS